MGYLCMSCFEEYKRDGLKLNEDSYESPCPKSNCYGVVVEIDDMILPIIKLLNQKGYISTFCCSNHSYEAGNKSNTYISFESECVPNTVPNGFYIEDKKWYEENHPNFVYTTDKDICIRKYYDDELDEFELHVEICKTMVDLMEWAEELDDISEEE